MRSAVDRLPGSPSETLRRKVAVVLPTLQRAGARLVAHPDVRRLYPEFLIACHFVVRSSVPLMEHALAVAGTLDDGVARGLRDYLPGHIDEERDHDEWVLEDLESMGIERPAVLDRPPPSTVASMVGAQYYWIHHYHPVALLGYMWVLEAYPSSPASIAELSARTGFGPAAFRALAEHADADPHHAAELAFVIDRLPLTVGQSSVIGLSALHTVVTQARVFDEIVDAVPDVRRNRA